MKHPKGWGDGDLQGRGNGNGIGDGQNLGFTIESFFFKLDKNIPGSGFYISNHPYYGTGSGLGSGKSLEDCTDCNCHHLIFYKK